MVYPGGHFSSNQMFDDSQSKPGKLFAKYQLKRSVRMKLDSRIVDNIHLLPVEVGLCNRPNAKVESDVY